MADLRLFRKGKEHSVTTIPMAWPDWHIIQLWLSGDERKTSRPHGFFSGFSGLHIAGCGDSIIFFIVQFKTDEKASDVPKI